MENGIEYVKCIMEYESDDMPVVYFYEVDLTDGRLARRAIEVFADGQAERKDDLYLDVVEILPIPTVEELNGNVFGDGFRATTIEKEEFEMIWNGRCGLSAMKNN